MQAGAVVQVEATKGVLWDAFAETAVYMEILHVQTSLSDSGMQQFTDILFGPARLHCAATSFTIHRPRRVYPPVSFELADLQCTCRGRTCWTRLRSRANPQ